MAAFSRGEAFSKTTDYLREHPNASHKEVTLACGRNFSPSITTAVRRALGIKYKPIGRPRNSSAPAKATKRRKRVIAHGTKVNNWVSVVKSTRTLVKQMGKSQLIELVDALSD